MNHSSGAAAPNTTRLKQSQEQAQRQAFSLGFESRLLSVDSRKVPLFRFDVLVIGSGAAGSAAALAAAANGAEVALLTKDRTEETNTVYAQGGLAAVLSANDSFDSHLKDTLAVGCGLTEREIAESVIRGGPEAVERLLSWGADLDREEDGSFALSREGGHSHPRIVHAQGDATGREIQSTVLKAIEEHPRITVFPKVFAVDLLQEQDGSVIGLLASDERGRSLVFSGGRTILCTGGSGQIYRETTNPSIATGDGVAMGFRAGACVRDLEFFQFHPTLLYIAGAARVLISEIVRGHGGLLRDRDGVRFMPAAHPAAELAPRDVVSRAVFRRMVETKDTSVYLDLSQIDGDPHRLFPGIGKVCRFFGIDIAKDPVPVRPGAHYQVGGLEVDQAGRTSLKGLWAVGECASSGLHGANRMGSNSLLEALVLGTRAGQAAAEEATDRGLTDFEVRPPRVHASAPGGVQVNIPDVVYSLKSLMWRQMGVERDESSMTDALDKIQLWTRAVEGLAPSNSRTWELLNMLMVSNLATIGALARKESRGVHWRSDFPESTSAPARHSRLIPKIDGQVLVSAEIERSPLHRSEEAADETITPQAPDFRPETARP